MQLLLEKKSLIITTITIITIILAVMGKNTSHSLFLFQNPLFPLTISSHLCFPFQRKRSQLQYLILNTRKAWQRTRRSSWLPCALWPKERSSWWRKTLLWRTSLPSRWLLSESDTCSWQVPFRSEGGHQRLGICAFSSSFGSQGWGQVVWMEGGGYNDRSQWWGR